MKMNSLLSLFALLLTIALMSARYASDGYKIGDTVQDFKLKNVDGKSVSLADQKNVKGYIIAFTCNTCPVAKAYESRIAYIGAIDNNQYDAAAADKKYVENAVNELLADKPVTTPSARAVGCGIKWKGV